MEEWERLDHSLCMGPEVGSDFLVQGPQIFLAGICEKFEGITVGNRKRSVGKPEVRARLLQKGALGFGIGRLCDGTSRGEKRSPIFGRC